ncbi:Signal recognition particle [Bonamia ostreae]|uniref:signal-recognition-particle GTPase n=1 Tax=Bonamia ostreae TaxID=126728 RepID=A0ABV2AJD4_9EUKA
MVLAELGGRLTNALKNMRRSNVIDKETIDNLLKEFGDALLEADVQRKLVVRLKVNIKKAVNSKSLETNANKRQFIEKTCIVELNKLLDSDKKPFKPKRKESNVVMFVGLQGSGKTTTVTKVAQWYKSKGWTTAIVCADTFRAGAFDQIKQNAMKIGVPFFGSYSESDPVVIAVEGVERFRSDEFEIILVDTSGRHKQEDSLFAEMTAISTNIEPDDVVFVMDSTIGQSAFEQAEAFGQAVSVGSVVLTKLDGHAKGGGAISAVSATQCPVSFIGTGEHFDDFEQFSAASFVSRLLGKWDVEGIVNLYNESKVDIDEPELMKKLMRGKFSLRDMKGQLQTILNMGPGLIRMIPGLGKMMPDDAGEKSQTVIKQYMTLTDSMTDNELDGDVKTLNDSRMLRISRGAGLQIAVLKNLLSAFKPFKKLGGNLGKIANKTGVSDLNKLSSSQLASAIDPGALKNFGGKKGFEQLINDFKKMDPEQMEEAVSKLKGKVGNMRGMSGRRGRRKAI